MGRERACWARMLMGGARGGGMAPRLVEARKCLLVPILPTAEDGHAREMALHIVLNHCLIGRVAVRETRDLSQKVPPQPSRSPSTFHNSSGDTGNGPPCTDHCRTPTPAHASRARPVVWVALPSHGRTPPPSPAHICSATLPWAGGAYWTVGSPPGQRMREGHGRACHAPSATATGHSRVGLIPCVAIASRGGAGDPVGPVVGVATSRRVRAEAVHQHFSIWAWAHLLLKAGSDMAACDALP